MIHPEAEPITRIKQWSQGDCVLEELPILWGFDKGFPLTETARKLAEESEPIMGVSIAGDAVMGLVLISQTCDIVRDVGDRPFIQVAPLVERDEQALELIRLRMMPRFAFLPALRDRRLVADMDRVLTVEKSFLAKWEKVQAFEDEPQRRSFAETVHRYYNRPAFPEPFSNALKKLNRWFQEKHDRLPSPAKPRTPPLPFHPGECMRALDMFLVRVNPSWTASTYHVDFFLVRRSATNGIPALAWEAFMKACKEKVSLPNGVTTQWQEILLSSLPAKLYIECDTLDFNYLSDETRLQ